MFGIRKKSSGHFFFEVILVLQLIFSGSVFAESHPPKILILYSAANNAPGQQQLAAGLNDVLSKKYSTTGNIQNEYLDIDSVIYPEQRQDILKILKKKYTDQHFDLIITVFNAALDFLVDDAMTLSPDTPAIAILARPRPPLYRAGKPIQQIPLTWDLIGTVSRALELFPKTNKLVFISGSTAANLEREKLARVELAQFSNRLTVEYTSDLTMPELLEHISHLPKDSIILYSAVAEDAAGHRFIPRDVAFRLAASANVPIFSYVSSMLDVGIVGGMMLDFGDYGRLLGEAVTKYDGSKPIALDALVKNIKPIFDWRQIERWNAAYKALPKDSVFLYRPESIWTQYRREVLVAAAVITALTLSLITALMQVRKRRLAEILAKTIAAELREVKNANELRLTQMVQDRTIELQAEMVRRSDAEIQAKASEFQYRLMADNSLDVLWKWSVAEQRFTYASSAVERLCGISVVDFISFPIENIFSSESITAFQTNIQMDGEAVHLRARVLDLAFRVQSEEYLWTETLMTVLVNPVTGKSEIVGVSRDISLKRRAQEEQRQFVAMVSHEFRNPLGLIRATAERMAERSARGIAPDPDQYHKIERSVDWLTDLIDEFFSESRLTLGSPGIHRADIDPVLLLQTVVEKVRDASHNHFIEVHATPWHGQISIDVHLITMALTTLVENAVKHTPPGSRVDLFALRAQDDGLDLIVTDNGPGISDDELLQVGNKFFRSRTAQSTSGSGLGVYMAKNIARLHGGTLTVQNRPEGGASFQIHLPPTTAHA